jgi:ribosomal subunit interface protein
MQIIFHTRQANLAADFKDIAKDKLQSLGRFNVLLDRIEVEIIHEQNPKQGKHSHKVILTAKGAGPLVRSEASEFNDVAAFDLAVKSFELQLRKIHEKSKDHNRDSIKNKFTE